MEGLALELMLGPMWLEILEMRLVFGKWTEFKEDWRRIFFFGVGTYS
jgi:hypothetical protein